MWYINMAAAAILFARLYAQELVRAYPFLCAYLFADCGSRKLCNIISGDAWGVEISPFSGFRIGFDCRLSGEICSVNYSEPLMTKSEARVCRRMGILVPDRGII